MKLFNYWTKNDDASLKLTLSTNNGVYDYPSYDEVINFLKETDYDGDMEEVMGDLIIQLIEGEFWLDKC